MYSQTGTKSFREYIKKYSHFDLNLEFPAPNGMGCYLEWQRESSNRYKYSYDT